MEKSKMGKRYSPEVCGRAVRMVPEHESSCETQCGAIAAIAPKIGCRPQTLAVWPRAAATDAGAADWHDQRRARSDQAA